MFRQLKPAKWIKLFRIYESLGTPKIWIEYAKCIKVTNSAKAWFIIKYQNFLEHAQNMTALISMSGKSPKKGTKVVRLKNHQTKHEIWKEFINEVGDDEIANLLNDLVENGDGNVIGKIKEIIKKKIKLSARKLAKILNASKSSICNLRNKNSNEENNPKELMYK